MNLISVRITVKCDGKNRQPPYGEHTPYNHDLCYVWHWIDEDAQ